VAARPAASPPDGHSGGGAKRGDVERCADSMWPGAGQLERDQAGGLRRSFEVLCCTFRIVWLLAWQWSSSGSIGRDTSIESGTYSAKGTSYTWV
jgi:hypothetical protein